MTQDPFSLLRRALLADAVVSGGFGLLLLLVAGTLGALLGLPEALLRVAGLLFLPWAAACAVLGMRPTPPAAAVGAVILLNGVYVLASLALPFVGIVAPNTLGTAFIIAQGLVVLLMAGAQFIGLRRVTLPA